MKRNSTWYIFNPAGKTPAAQHETYDSALRECNRLASTNPGQEFIICKAVFALKQPISKPEIYFYQG